MIDFKQRDSHTPEFYWKQFGSLFTSQDGKTAMEAFYGFMFMMKQDFDSICPNPKIAGIDFVRQAVDYMDRKYTACIKYFHNHGWAIAVPENGYRRSLFEAFPEIAKIYGPDKKFIPGFN